MSLPLLTKWGLLGGWGVPDGKAQWQGLVVFFLFSFSCMSVLILGFRPGMRSVHQTTRVVHRQRSVLVSKVLTCFLGGTLRNSL